MAEMGIQGANLERRQIKAFFAMGSTTDQFPFPDFLASSSWYSIFSLPNFKDSDLIHTGVALESNRRVVLALLRKQGEQSDWRPTFRVDMDGPVL